MNISAYHCLINDTLTYIKELLPSDKDLPPLGESNSERIKEEALPTRKVQGVQHKEPQNELLKEDSGGSESSHKKNVRSDRLAVEASPSPVLNQQKEGSGKAFIELEPPKSAPPHFSEETRKILKEMAPDLYYHENVPSDSRAKRIKEAWKEKRSTPAIPARGE